MIRTGGVTLPKRATSLTWDSPHPCKQALRLKTQSAEKFKKKTRTFLLTSENLVLQAMQFFIKSSDTQALVTKHAVCVLPHATARTRLPSMSTSHGSGLKKTSVFERVKRWCYTGRFATTIFSATQRYNIVVTTSVNRKPRKKRTVSAGETGWESKEMKRHREQVIKHVLHAISAWTFLKYYRTH